MSYTEVGQENVNYTLLLTTLAALIVLFVVISALAIQMDRQKKQIVQLELDRAEMTQHLNQAYRALKDVDYQINVLTAEVMK